MPFLPMKYPEYRITMEAALPSSVHCWLKHELEQLGIDSLVYTRYIISLLLQDEEDLEDLDTGFDTFPQSKRKGRRSGKQKRLSSNDEERKKYAAVQCLMTVTDEKAGIETLVDELCSRLKDSELQVSPDVKSRSCSSDGSDDSGTENQNPAQRYYAAFPALHGQSASTNLSPSETIWRNNPMVKPQTSLTSEEDTSSANEDAEIRKINIPCPVAIPKHRKPRKNNSRNRKEHADQYRKKDKSTVSMERRGKKVHHDHTEKQETMVWPPGFAKLDPMILQSLDLMDDSFVHPQSEYPQRPKNELCTKVESLLKGMLLPAPEKTYKDLLDVDDSSPVEIREKSEKAYSKPLTSDKKLVIEGKSVKEEADSLEKSIDGKEILSSSPRDESVSPELQEQEIWYTQPIDVIFHSQDDEVSNSKLRLYKRLSDPAFSPDQDTGSVSDPVNECFQSSASSPIGFGRYRSHSFASDKSDDIWEGSVLIPAWLTEEISKDENGDDSSYDIDLANSLKSSSPFPESDSGLGFSKFADLSMSDDGHNLCIVDGHKPLSEIRNSAKEDLWIDKRQALDENCTPTPEDVQKRQEDCSSPSDRPVSVSLVDLDYMSKFIINEPSWQSYSPEDSLSSYNPRRTCITALWQSQVLFDSSLNVPCSLSDLVQPVYELYDIHCWQPIGSSPFSQLWDVNMQKRSKMSIWGGQIFSSDSQVWFAENTLVFLHDVSSLSVDVGGIDQGENTLIPHISIDIVSEADSDGSPFLTEEEEEDERIAGYFDRSVSMGDVPSLWDDEFPRGADPKLSKSFELVPSEHSAFNDVPRKLLHVHSEPNLVQFRQEFADGNQTAAHSPQEHLYFSPKTHFRPITPAYVPDLYTSKSKQQVCHDLFGGLPSTKTPYQQYQVLDKESDEESFIPRFKVKNYSKSIQTGESFEKVESPADSNETLERDTPETLTLSMIEDVMEEKIDQLVSIEEDQDAANTDSAYETDYGGNVDQDQQPSGCFYKNKEHNKEGNADVFGSSNVDHGNLGEMINYTVQSFVATFPHTNDWPDGSAMHSGSHWMETDLEYPLESWPPAECPDVVKEDENFEGSYHAHGVWGDDLGLDHLYRESEMEKYKNIWSSAGHDYYCVDTGVTGKPSNISDLDDCEEEFENVPTEGYYGNMFIEAYNGKEFFEYEPVLEPSDQMIESLPDTDGVFPTYAGFPDHEELQIPPEMELTPENDTGDYFSVKLVYKDKQIKEGDQHQTQSYGTYELMPMPDEGVMSTELEKQWMDPSIRAMWTGKKASSLQRKPCSFYLEGNCRRSDCKFAHDISNITCRFWEEGGCFKGPLCPFLHGYPRLSSPTQGKTNEEDTVEKEKFDLNNEEFPELSLSVKNGNSNNVIQKKTKAAKVQNLLPSGRRDKSRKGSGRRHSNKENRCEVKIVNKCSSSI